jgi:choline-sulfatase
VSYCHPHEPFHVTQELWDLYEGQEIQLPDIPADLADREHPMDRMLNLFHGTHRVDLDDKQALYNMRRAYYGLVTYVDRKVGELLQALEDYGLKDNTIVVFLSDHGDMLGEHRMVQKRTFYEYSARIPWLVHHPRLWQEGVTVEEPVSIVDVMPTVLDMVGVPQEQLLSIDGRSVVPLMDGHGNGDRTVFCEHHSEGVNMTCFMARQGNFKYIHTTGYRPQLYDLSGDPGEWHNLAGQPVYTEIERRLHDLITKQFNADRIETDIQDSLARRQVIREAITNTGLPKWDYQPLFDATRQYWRAG